MKVDFKPIILGKPHAYVSQWVSSYTTNIEQYNGPRKIKCYSNGDGICFDHFMRTWKDDIKCGNYSVYNMIRVLIDRFNIVSAKNLKITPTFKSDNFTKISRHQTLTCDIHTDSDGSLWIDMNDQDMNYQVNDILGITFESLSIRFSSSSFNLWDFRTNIINIYDRYLNGIEPLDKLTDNVLNRMLFIQVSPINLNGLADGVSTWNLSSVALGLKDTAGKGTMEALKAHKLAIHSVVPITDEDCNVTRDCVILYPIKISEKLEPLQYPNTGSMCSNCKEDDVLSFKVTEVASNIEVQDFPTPQMDQETVITVKVNEEKFTIEMLVTPAYVKQPTNVCWPSCSN